MKNNNSEKIPVFGKWPGWYLFVGIFNLLLLVVFILLTSIFNHK
ncbi:MAG TPA: hypothetical protein PKN57_06720 [Saprospiraceae bacterium]|nr:hypothetical protein [Saprospiraceae bacterium]HMW75056.1 hypothetical protein [Saprospiraceae bacterium]HMX83915.1 hypothetical protein [Saprospiraceae bacterium]HMX86478.1 hypothetical protein [Saprospiraceae bacterium]HMZ72988.1 hypothetical protein [Saprospiraceae bacterium]